MEKSMTRADIIYAIRTIAEMSADEDSGYDLQEFEWEIAAATTEDLILVLEKTSKEIR